MRLAISRPRWSVAAASSSLPVLLQRTEQAQRRAQPGHVAGALEVVDGLAHVLVGRLLVTQDDIAGLTGAGRPTVNQVLRTLEGAGAIELHRGRIDVVDRAVLARHRG